MSKITDYSFLFHSMFGTKSTKGASAIGSFQLSQLNSSSVQAQLRAAGIDTNSKQYKAAIKQIDNVLNNGAEKKEQEQTKGRISIKEKLAEKRAVIEQRDKTERTSPEKETEKKSQREM